MTVRQLLTSLDSAELSEWMAYCEVEAERGEKPENDEVAWRKAFNAW